MRWLLCLLVGLTLGVVWAQDQKRRVSTAQELQDAVTEGVYHIILTEHVDLRSLTPSSSGSSTTVMELKEAAGEERTTIIEGNCTKPFDGAFSNSNLQFEPPLLSKKTPTQCAIVVQRQLFEVTKGGGKLWLNNLYIRLQRVSAASGVKRLLTFRDANVWMTNVTLQSDESGEAQALYPFANALLRIQDSAIQNFNGTLAPIAELQTRSSLLILNSVLAGNSNLNENGTAFYINDDGRRSCAVRIENSQLNNNADPLFKIKTTGSGNYYINGGAAEVFNERELETEPAKGLSTTNQLDPQFLKAEDRPEVRPDPPPGTTPAPGPDGPDNVATPADGPMPGVEGDGGDGGDGDGGGGGVSVGVIAAIVGVVVAALLGIIGFFVWRKKKKSKRTISDLEKPSSVPPPMNPDPSVNANFQGGVPQNGMPPPGMPPNYHVGQPGMAAGSMPGWGFPGHMGPMGGPEPYPGGHPGAVPGGLGGPWGGPSRHGHHGHFGGGGIWDSFHSNASAPYGPSAVSSTPPNGEMTKGGTTTIGGTISWGNYQKGDTPSEKLEAALDALYDHKLPFYSRYNLLSSVERRVGGQGLVQFARIGSGSEMAAIKFYLQRAAFDAEKELYMDSKLKSMMPAILSIEDNINGTYHTPYGYVFPPFVIIERGQSLDEWARDNKPDFITIFQALSHSVRALKELHKIGYAHRDIKPGNILRRPMQHDWTLIDFGCAAPIGITHPLTLSLKYAAPETICALEAGCRTIHVDAAVDIWAIGVIAFELLTGERAFPSIAGETPQECDERVKRGIAGRTPLPWEPKDPGSEARLAKMRGLKRTVMRCLSRDPTQRPTADQLLHSWDHTFDNMQTRGTDWSATSGGSGAPTPPVGGLYVASAAEGGTAGSGTGTAADRTAGSQA